MCVFARVCAKRRKKKNLEMDFIADFRTLEWPIMNRRSGETENLRFDQRMKLSLISEPKLRDGIPFKLGLSQLN